MSTSSAGRSSSSSQRPVAGRRASRAGTGRRSPRRPGRGPVRANTIAAWVGAVAALAVLASLSGRAGTEGPAPPSATPQPSGGPLPISFGTGLDEGSHLVTGETDSFSPGDAFAYSVDPPTPPGVAKVYVAVARIDTGGGETEVQPPTAQNLRPAATSFGFQTTATPLIVAWGEGRYVMRIYLDPFEDVYAQGRFILVEPTLPQ